MADLTPAEKTTQLTTALRLAHTAALVAVLPSSVAGAVLWKKHRVLGFFVGGLVGGNVVDFALRSYLALRAAP